MNNVWYAVQHGAGDDWETGSTDYDKARAIADEFANAPLVVNNDEEVRLLTVLCDDGGIGDVVDHVEIIRDGINFAWRDIEVIPRRIYCAYYDDCPVIYGVLYDVVESDDTATAVIGTDRENGYRFVLNVGSDGMNVEIRRAEDPAAFGGTLVKYNRKAVFFI